jgi:hypothetical protein
MGRENSGKAAAAAMTAEERKARAMKGVEARKRKAGLPNAAHKGSLKLGDMQIPCAVLEDGRRIISENGINSTLGSSGGKSLKLRDNANFEHGPLPLFLSSKALHPFVNDVFDTKDLETITYLDSGKEYVGYPAHILPKVCEVWLKARDANALQRSQIPKTIKAEIMMRALAHIGITALVDEATGYQDAREKDALAKIFEEFVAKELQPWIKTFPDEYYKQLFRLYGYDYPNPKQKNFRPQFFGKVTNKVVYKKLAPEILPELKRQANKLGKKSAKLHQTLTSDVGHPKLREHLASIVTLMKLSEDKDSFFEKVDLIHPDFSENYVIDLDV